MEVRAVNFLMSHGLGFWKALDSEEGQKECLWLLGDMFPANRVTHVIIPTESVHYSASGFTFEKLRWLVERVRANGMTAVIWGDKLHFWASSAISWWGKAVDLFGSSVVYNLSQEVDLLWASDGLSKNLAMSRLTELVNYLISRGVPRDRIWAGGATREGTIQIAKSGVGVLTYTMYRDVQGALNVRDVPAIPLAESTLTSSLRIIKALTNLPILLVEFGHYTTWGGERLQRDVLELCIRSARNADCIGVGLWVWLDFWSCDGPAGWCSDDSRSYGILKLENGEVVPKSGYWVIVEQW